MKTSLETERLLLRELLPSDDQGMFALDSDPEVHKFLWSEPFTRIEQSREIIEYIRQQYADNGIGRWAAIEKSSGEFIGWTGLKLERNVNGRDTFYDIGYRLRREFWGKGYATESTKAFIDFGFSKMKIKEINAYANETNLASRNALQKCGLKHTETFDHEGIVHCWYEIRNPNTGEEL